MEVRCDLCGCETEEEQLKEYLLSGENCKVCVFCRKELASIALDPQKNLDKAINMLNRDTKGKRTEKTNTLLKNQFRAMGINIDGPVPTVNRSVNQEIEALKKQVEDLKKDLTSFKRRYYISKVLGIVLPIVFIVIMLIILIASGALGNLFDYYDQIMELANK